MFTEINYTRMHNPNAPDYEVEYCAQQIKGRVFDINLDDDSEFDCAKFSIYHFDINKAFEIGIDPVDLLDYTDSDINSLYPYLEPGGIIRNFIYLETISVKPEFRRMGAMKNIVEHVGRLWSELPLVLCAVPMDDLTDVVSQDELASWYESVGFKRLKYVEPKTACIMERPPADPDAWG